MSDDASEPAFPPGAVFTVGHSTLAIERFIEALQTFGVEALADIRTVPRSRHNPQFNADALGTALEQAHIAYVPMPELGGLRRPDKHSLNTAWRNDSFRGYADYMQTPAFGDALLKLMALAAVKSTAIMCAEAVPWRCHRSLVGDALAVRGIPVVEILSATSSRLHKLTPFAHVDGTAVTYPEAQQAML